MAMLLILIPILFIETNSEFFDQAAKELDKGYTWHYVGEQEIDSKSKSIAINGKYIYWKLKK